VDKLGPKLKIAHLYPDYLNLYGDQGNILSFTRRLEWRGIDYEVQNISIGDHDKKYTDYHFFFIGGGQDSQQEQVAKDFLLRINEFKHIVENNVPVLAVCGGYQLLGKSYQTSDGFEIPGLGILDIYTKAKATKKGCSQDRLIGNVSAKLVTDFATKPQTQTLVGFENHSGRTYISKDSPTKPLAKVIRGFGNNGEDDFEGAAYKRLIGTYLHGSLLPKNPHLTDELIFHALKAAKHPYLEKHPQLSTINDELELEAHEFALSLK